jgi:hypothetical protein
VRGLVSWGEMATEMEAALIRVPGKRRGRGQQSCTRHQPAHTTPQHHKGTLPKAGTWSGAGRGHGDGETRSHTQALAAAILI